MFSRTRFYSIHTTWQQHGQLTIARGLIGPQRLFSKGSLYAPQLYATVVGAVLPIPIWYWVRRKPQSILRNLNLPVLFNGSLGIPPATGINYSSWLVTGFIFQFWMRRRRFAWYSKVSSSCIHLEVEEALRATRGIWRVAHLSRTLKHMFARISLQSQDTLPEDRL